MPKAEQRPPIPEWAARERTGDLAWLAENLHILWPAAQAAFAEQGRGAITVDTTVRPPGGGHPFWYLTQGQIQELGEQDTLRMVARYAPTWEFVAMLLKTLGRVSSYRVGVPTARLQQK